MDILEERWIIRIDETAYVDAYKEDDDFNIKNYSLDVDVEDAYEFEDPSFAADVLERVREDFPEAKICCKQIILTECED